MRHGIDDQKQQKQIYASALAQLSIKEFAQLYGISPSTARREIAKKRLAVQVVRGQNRINHPEAERWLASNGNMVRAINLSRPDLTPTVLNRHDSWALYLCGNGYGNVSDTMMARRVARLRAKGFDIEIVPRREKPHLYRLWDVVGIQFGNQCFRVGPHLDLIMKPPTVREDK